MRNVLVRNCDVWLMALKSIPQHKFALLLFDMHKSQDINYSSQLRFECRISFGMLLRSSQIFQAVSAGSSTRGTANSPAMQVLAL